MESDTLIKQLEAANTKASYWKQIAKRTGLLRLRESENLSNMIQTLKQTEARLVNEINERQRVAEALRESEEHLRAILEASPDPMVMYDMKGHPKFLNNAFSAVFGWTLDESKGQQIPFVPESQKTISMEKIREIYASKKTSRFETQRLTKDHRLVDVIVSAAIIQGGDREPIGMVVNLTDITERKVLEAKYEQAERMKSLGTLSGGIAHDFNNILMGVQGRASLMMVDLESTHPHYDHIKGIEEYIQSATGLTKQLLGFARGGKYEVKPVDLNELIQTSAEMFARTKKEILIHTELQASIHVVEADRGQIEQVLLNIYVNAWQAMPGGGSLNIETRNVSLDTDYCKPYQVEPGSYVKISITDNGQGMDKSILDRIFDPFFTTKERTRGTGLGLASAYGIIKNHGGLITVYSEIGHGTTFNIYLPVSDRKAAKTVPVERRLLMGSETILIVDDEKMITDVGQAMLEMLGYQVVVAQGGRQAVEAITKMENNIHLVLLDMIMPGMDGLKTFNRIREIQPMMPVLLSSGYAINDQAEEIMRRGCNGFIQKPFSVSTLSVRVRDILDEAKGSRKKSHMDNINLANENRRRKDEK